ncbi:outer membrane protein assembly factor BamC [Halothiobacillus sp. DCM-1]|uniref:outer membrane protein assembly factor BamC n=1 Tax=Halothiobacillus sp. DCM-1 TaxID=3112558 RepID=UPI003244A3CF
MSSSAASFSRFKLSLLVGLALSTGALSGCSSIPFFGSDKPAPRAATLDVPPAFTPPSPSAELALPEIASAKALAAENRANRSGVLVGSNGVQVMGGADSRYLAVAAAPDAVWPKLQDFLQDEGYVIKKIDPAAGYMETDWTGVQSAANTGFDLMSFLKIAKDTFFKPDHIEKLRLRIEKGDSGNQTLVFVTAQKMDLTGEKPYFPGDEESSFKYANAKPDNTLSANMMARLTSYLSGKTEAESRALMAQNFAPRSKILFNEDKDQRYLIVSQPYPQVWNRLGLALDRLGFDPVTSNIKDGRITVTHNHPQSLYQGMNLRGKTVGAHAKIQLELRAKPQPDGTVRIDVEKLTVTGGELPDPRFAVLSQINSQLE